MPNVCSNYFTVVSGDAVELQSLVTHELTREEGAEHYFKNIIFTKKCPYGIQFRQDTKWRPDFEWMQRAIVKYPNCWVKNEWIEEGGTAGVWVGSLTNGIQSMTWEDLCIEAKHQIFN